MLARAPERSGWVRSGEFVANFFASPMAGCLEKVLRLRFIAQMICQGTSQFRRYDVPLQLPLHEPEVGEQRLPEQAELQTLPG